MSKDEALAEQSCVACEGNPQYPNSPCAVCGCKLEQPAQQEPVVAIRALTDQCFALIQERDELQKQVWRYEKNGVTCQTYRHKVDASCAECNVHEVYTSPPAQRKPLTEGEIQKLLSQNRFAVFALVRAIEAAHGIKENT